MPAFCAAADTSVIAGRNSASSAPTAKYPQTSGYRCWLSSVSGVRASNAAVFPPNAAWTVCVRSALMAGSRSPEMSMNDG